MPNLRKRFENSDRAGLTSESVLRKLKRLDCFLRLRVPGAAFGDNSPFTAEAHALALVGARFSPQLELLAKVLHQ